MSVFLAPWASTWPEHGGGHLLYAPLDVVLSSSNVVAPDVFIVADAQDEIIIDANIQGAPALVIEVLSDFRMDRVRKRDLYARFKVPEYWIVDTEADRVEIYRLGERGYGKPEIFEAGEIITLDLLPGFSLDVGSLFVR